MLPLELLPLIALFLSPVFALPVQDQVAAESPIFQSLPLYSSVSSSALLSDRAIWESSKLRTRYGHSDQESLAKRQTSIPLTNVNADSSYYAEIEIGSDTTPIRVLVDTGSADLWLASANCSTCSSSTARFSQAASATLDVSTEEFEIRYGSGEASGYLASDSMSWGGYAVANQTFALCNQVSSGLLSGQVSGLLGLGFQSISNSEAKPFWQAAGINEMSFALTRYLHDPQATSEEPGGYLTLGGTNSSLYQGNINYHSLTSSTYWLLTIDGGFKVNGEVIDSTRGARAAVDTGTSLIGAPVDQVDDIYAQIPGSFRSEDPNFEGYHEYPCDVDFNTSISFDGIDYPIYSRDFNLGTTNEYNGTQYCLGAVFELTAAGLPAWIIGNSFLKSYYTVFRADPPAVGFATLRDAEVFATGNFVSSAPSKQLPLTWLIFTTSFLWLFV